MDRSVDRSADRTWLVIWGLCKLNTAGQSVVIGRVIVGTS